MGTCIQILLLKAILTRTSLNIVTMNLLLPLLFLGSLLVPSLSANICMRGKMIDTPVFCHCDGSVTLYQGTKVTVVTGTTDQLNLRRVDRVKFEGCGSFALHTRPCRRGRTFSLERTGEFRREQIGFSRVRSVSRTGC